MGANAVRYDNMMQKTDATATGYPSFQGHIYLYDDDYTIFFIKMKMYVVSQYSRCTEKRLLSFRFTLSAVGNG